MDGKIIRVSGPLIVAEGMSDCKMYDVVRVGKDRLIGEIIELRDDRASVQVYEETSGLGPGDSVISTGSPLSVELAPGLIESIFDGIQRPLTALQKESGDRISKGIEVKALDRNKKWNFTPVVKEGDELSAGDVIGTVQETEVIEHKILVPHNTAGKVKKIYKGEFAIEDTVCILEAGKGEVKLSMLQKWPVRRGRPYKSKITPSMPMSTGQRVIDTLFPIARGGVAAVPGPFGSGKTVVQHQLAKWANADLIVYVGCGERGNEMTDVLNEFPQLKDTRTGYSLMKRTVLIANTSDMPVAAREASIYTGITIAEYYRDMGLNVAIMADSTSRWAEALREMSGRLEEMPGEEGYPAYLSSRLAEFYERAGVVKVAGRNDITGSVTAIGAVSPQGGDLSEPVSQATLRIVKVFWGLSSSLAYKRHFPAIDWMISYSLYSDRLSDWFSKNVDRNFNALRRKSVTLLQEEAEIEEIVRLVGIDSISVQDRLVLEVTKSIREDYLHQNAFHETDTHTSLQKQHKMLNLILEFYQLGKQALSGGAELSEILDLKVRERISRSKYIPEDKLSEFDEISEQLIKQMANIQNIKEDFDA